MSTPQNRARRSDGKVRVAIVGVGNCASSLVHGVEYYKNAKDSEVIPGLMHVNLGGYHIRDIEFVAAFDVDTLKQKWALEQRAAILTAALSTAGGVVFIGDLGRSFKALDVRDGKVVWQTRLATSVQGFPITFSVNGRQFVAVPTGTGPPSRSRM